jgi:hypothetical protein
VNTVIKVFTKVCVKEFYAENASFFLVVIGLAFGFMSGVEHKALAEFFISSPSATLIPICVWALYALKVINFNAAVTDRKENEFVFNHSLYPERKQYINISFVLFNQLAPVIGYSLFLAATAIKFGAILSLMTVICGVAFLLVVSSIALKHKLNNPNQEKRIWLLNRTLNRLFIRPYPVFVIEWLSRKKTFLLISTMAFCSLMLFGVLMLYTTDRYDFRLLQMGLVLVVSGNVQLIGEVHRFETLHFNTVAQMPISFLKRLGFLVPVFIFLSFPQIGLLIRYFPGDLNGSLLFQFVGFIIGYSFFLYGNLYRAQRGQEQTIRFTFVCALLWFVLTLFALPIWLITIMSFSIGVILWKKNFYTFEIISDKEVVKSS